MKRYLLIASLCAGVFGLSLAKVAESRRRSNRIIELQAAILANADDAGSRKLLESYDSRRPFSMFTTIWVFAAGAGFLVACQYFGSRYKASSQLCSSEGLDGGDQNQGAGL